MLDRRFATDLLDALTRPAPWLRCVSNSQNTKVQQIEVYKDVGFWCPKRTRACAARALIMHAHPMGIAYIHSFAAAVSLQPVRAHFHRPRMRRAPVLYVSQSVPNSLCEIANVITTASAQ
jgi:hypothetical protein